MNKKSRIALSIMLSMLTIACIFMYRYLLKEANLIGDTKSGLGNPIKALQIEDSAISFQIGASFLTGGLIAILFFKKNT
ncbi:MAG: hypothetical protein JXA71_01430 [Chitinispirillaceae bacterium]|nr:hypothetical protein [Chitinispirillaceae bacterium]